MLLRCAARARSLGLQARRRHVACQAAATTWVDTHAHIDLIGERLGWGAEGGAEGGANSLGAEYDAWRETLPRDQAFEGVISVACSTSTFDAVAALVREEERNVYGAFGIHPLNAKEWNDAATRARVVELLGLPRAVAVGECGLDYHYGGEDKKLQRDVFVQQIRLAAELDRPLVVHTREADDDCLAILREELPREHLVHVHCFTSSVWLAEALLSEFPGVHLGFTGVVTFKNAEEVRDVVRVTPLERLLLETDAPYMAPVPFRGKVAHPGHCGLVAAKIAEIKGVGTEDVLRNARENTRRVYGI